LALQTEKDGWLNPEIANDFAKYAGICFEHFGDRVYRTVIPRNVALAEAPSHGQSILKYNKNSRGSMAYLALAGEVLRREAKKNHHINQ
jgi:cellulose biosynthesis protein BcsQ